MPKVPNANSQHFFGKWYPIEALGEGGGGKVFRCIRRTLVDETVRFNERSGGMSFSAGGREGLCADFLDAVNAHLIIDRDGVAAVKVPHRLEDQTNLERFKRELTAMKTCRHPALIRLIDQEPGDRPRWFAMEYHPNGNLNDNAGSYQGNPVAALTALRPVIEATAKLHEQGYIHRDIKPNNIFLNGAGQLILGDLGIVFTEQERLTHGDTLFSRDWVPDWVRFRDIAPEKKVDVFMLAKVLFYMLTGRRVMATQIDEAENDLRALFPNAPGIDDVYGVLLSSVTGKDRDCRYEDAAQLLTAVDTLLSVVADNGRTRLLFNYLSLPGHGVQHVVMLRPGAHDSRYSQLTNIPIYVPFTCQAFRARARVVSPNAQSSVSVHFRIDDQSSAVVTDQYPCTDPGEWTRHEIKLVPSRAITKGWHILHVHPVSEVDGGVLTGFMLYGE